MPHKFHLYLMIFIIDSQLDLDAHLLFFIFSFHLEVFKISLGQRLHSFFFKIISSSCMDLNKIVKNPMARQKITNPNTYSEICIKQLACISSIEGFDQKFYCENYKNISQLLEGFYFQTILNMEKVNKFR